MHVELLSAAAEARAVQSPSTLHGTMRAAVTLRRTPIADRERVVAFGFAGQYLR